MSKQNKFSIAKRLKSFVYAFRGIRILISEEPNALVQLIAAILSVAAGFFLGISVYEWMALLICIGMVMAMEAMNSAIENLADFVSPDQQQKIAKVKDLGAAAVLILAGIAMITGLIIFLPKIYSLL